MATTVDHLSADHRVMVIKDFVDARGLSVPEGASGLIRFIDLDLKAMEFFIDWEREGKTERLTFSLNAKEGPRNGGMKEYFELGEYAPPPRPPKQPKPETPLSHPERAIKRPEAALSVHEGRQPQQEICLDELTVACGCGPVFHRSVYPAGTLGVHACMKCGAVTVTKQVGDDGRFTGDAWTAYWTVPTPQVVVDWLGRFPRVAIHYPGAPWRWPMSASLVRYPTLLYPSDVRVADIDELKALEDTLWGAQQPMTRADRLRSACGDVPAPPAGLPDDFNGFVWIQQTLDLRPNASFPTLKALAHLRSPACELAAALLLRRPDAYDLMMQWLRSRDEDEFGAGIAMLRDSRTLFSGPDDPRLGPELLALLDTLPLGKLKDVPNRVESWFRFEALLVATADLGVATSQMLDGLNALMKKLAKKDPHVVDAIRIVINELNGVDNRPEEYR
ncbi:MAG: hypothetical protein Q8R02_05960 [Hyphomonadaceae bacterium]|nr:hypothetical protein [Hyphomonadaceae bacterium]